MSDALHPVSRVAARHGLADEPGAAPIGPPDDEGWARVRTELVTHGLVGLLAAAHRDGAVELTDEQAASVADQELAAATAALRIEAACSRTAEVIEPHGISLRVLKGVATAHLDYPDPMWRVFNDVDILVRGPDIERVVDVLAAAGYPRDLPERRAGFDRRYAKDVEIQGPEGVIIDLHRTFAIGSYGFRQVVDDLWRDSQTFSIGGRRVEALVPEDRLLQACFAEIFGNRPPRAGGLRDIVQLLAREDLDVDLVARRIETWRCAPVVAAAIEALEAVIGIRPCSPLVGWLADRPASRWEQALLGAYPNFGGSHVLANLSGVVAAPGLTSKLGYLRGLALTDRGYRRARREASLLPEWRLLLRQLARKPGA